MVTKKAGSEQINNGKVALYQRFLAIAHMTSCKTNKKGIRLLATIAVFAMVFATVAVITDDSPDVEGTVAESDVAKIGENGYGTLEEAIRDANKGDVILLKNTTLDADLNDDVVIRSEGSKLTITMKQCVDISADVALKNVEIATDHSEGMIFDTTGVKLNLTFDGVSFDASCAGRTVYIQGEATASFENSDFTNSKLVYIRDMHVPMITINSTRNVDLNVQCVGSTTGSVSIGNEIKVEDSKLGTVKIQDTKLVVLPETELKAEKILNRGGNSSVDCMGTVVASKVTVPVKITGEGRATIDEAVASSSSEINAMIGAGMKEILIDKPEMTLDESVTIPEGVTLTIMGTLMTSATEKIINISEGASLILDGADVRVPVIVDDDAYVSIVNPKSMEVKGEATSDLFVGYGNTLVIADLTIPAGKGVYAYGIVKVQGTVNLVSGAEFNVYACGEADIEGKLNVAGTVNTAGEFNVISLVAVYNDSGNASFNVTDGTVTVESGAEFSVTKVRQSGVTATNDLVIANEAEFIVEGKLIVTGNLQGIILDKGEVVFNGTSVWGGSEDDAVTGIVIYDGVSLTITSVAGYIVVTDKGIADSEAKTNGVLNANTAVYDGNMVVLKDVKGVTVSAELDYSSKTIGNVSWKVYRSTLTVSGTVVALDETVDAAGTLVNPAVIGIENGSFPRGSGIPAAVESSFQGAVIIEDVTLAKYVILGVGGSQIKVTGTITAVAEKSAIVIREGKTTVNGSIIVGPKAVDLVGEQYIQGVKYEVQDAEANFTTFYTTLDAALGASSTAYEGKLSVFNSISVEADTTVPADITLFLSADATLSVSKEAVLKISAGALLDGTKGGISVSATLIIEDKNTGLKYNSITGMFTYQVYTENGDVATYTGIVVALKNAVSGDVITLKLGTTIDSSITVGEGVKLVVPNKVELFIGSSSKDVAVTVDGTLEIQRGGSVEKKVGTKEVTFVINGVVSDAQGDGIAFADDGIQAEDFVIFKRKVDGREVKFYSNLEYAAQNAVSGVIIVVGDVSAGDIVLTKANDADYLVLFMGGGASVNVTTLKLVDSSIKMNHDEGGVVNPEITGTVVVPSGDGEAKAEFNGTNIEYIGSEKDSEEKALFVIGGVLHGKATILSGTVNVDDVLTVGTMKSDVLTIASGATLNVPEGTHFAKKNNTESGTIYCAVGDRDYTALIIEGTLYVKNGGAFIVFSTPQKSIT